MATAGHTPNFVAVEHIQPFAAVTIAAPLKVGRAVTGYPICGICDGSVSAYDNGFHALAGQTVSLQNGEFMQGRAAGKIQAADLLVTQGDGFFVMAGLSNQPQFQAAENAEAGEVFWVFRIGGLNSPATVTMTNPPPPSAPAQPSAPSNP